MKKNDNNEISEKKTNKPYGAYLNFESNDQAFKAEWKYWEKEPEANIEDIPCVLGATYAASKRYWQYLRGLEGLISYGSDEPYISLKVWLEGGRCRLLKDIVIGHIYRKSFPYPVEHIFIIYNMLFVAEVLFPQPIKYRIFEQIKRMYASTFKKAYKMLPENDF